MELCLLNSIPPVPWPVPIHGFRGSRLGSQCFYDAEFGFYSAHLAEERRALPLDTLDSIKVHRRRPCLPITSAGPAGLSLNPLVKTPLRLVLVPRFHQFGQGLEPSPRQVHPPHRYACRHIEATDKRPDTAVVILAGPVVLLVSRPPVGIVAQ